MAEVYTPADRHVLLHVCCAPCAAPCIERLLANGCRVELYFSNSNIDTAEEFERRLQYVKLLADHHKIPCHIDPYDHDDWLAVVKEYADAPEGGARCGFCFSRVLGRTAAKAEELGIGSFTTTLTVSPHKNSRIIFAAGSVFNGFEAVDFKKKDGFLRSIRLSEKFGFYRQAYCGCEFSRNF